MFIKLKIDMLFGFCIIIWLLADVFGYMTGRNRD